MLTWVYKSARKANIYLYVERDGDFTRVPSALLDQMGRLDFVLKVDLSARERLATANIQAVRTALDHQGYFLQLPPGRPLWDTTDP